jgi:glutaredoxin
LLEKHLKVWDKGCGQKAMRRKNIMNNTITELSLASLKGCTHCAAAKLALAKQGITYKEILWDDPKGEALIESLGIQSVPVLLVPTKDGLQQIAGEKAIAEWAKSR